MHSDRSRSRNACTRCMVMHVPGDIMHRHIIQKTLHIRHPHCYAKRQLQKRRKTRRGTGTTQRQTAFNLLKKAEAAQAEKQALDRKQRCLVQGREEAMEARGYAARPTLIKAAMHGGFVTATTNGYFVTTLTHANARGRTIARKVR